MCVTNINLGLDIKQGANLRWTRDHFELTGMSLSIARGGPMLQMPRLCVSLVSEAGMSHHLALRSREVKRLLLDSYGGTDQLTMFPLFLKRTAEVLAPRLAMVFRRFFRLGSFPVCWRVANVTPIPKGPPSYSASNYRPISLTPILSKVLECLVSVRLGRFMECRGVLPTTQFTYRKGLGTCDALLVWHTAYRVH